MKSKTKGTKGQVSSDIQNLFDYINSNVITSNFTQEIADTIVNIKNDKKVRAAYMTYEMRLKDLRNEAFYDCKINIIFYSPCVSAALVFVYSKG